MLGKVRGWSWSSLEELEMERTPPSSTSFSSTKLVKHDSLSIYEITLMKLKQGSRCDLSLSNTEADTSHVTSIIPDGEEAMTLGPECSSAATSPNSSECGDSIGTTNKQENKNVSVLYLFSRYKNSRHGFSLPEQSVTVVENGCFPPNTSHNSSVG